MSQKSPDKPDTNPRYIHIPDPNPVTIGSPASFIYAQCKAYGLWNYYKEAIDNLMSKGQWPYGFQEQYDFSEKLPKKTPEPVTKTVVPKLPKKQRLLTNRDFENPSAFEFIEMEEIDGKQYLYQRFGEDINGVKAEGCFPISVELVQERFQELGRSYVSSGKEVAKVVSDLLVD